MTKKHAAPSQRSAFTLVELLVVIAIIAILAGLLFPVIGKVRIRGVETRTISNLKQVGVAIGAYSADHENKLPGPLSVEQYPSFGTDPKRDEGSIARLLATYLSLSERKSAEENKVNGNDVLACPLLNAPEGGKLEDIAGYIMNMENLPDFDQPAWGNLEGDKPPLTRTALTNWRDTSPDSASQGGLVNLSRKWAMRHTDKRDAEKMGLKGDWIEKLPKEPVFGYNANKPEEAGNYVGLFFDLHVENFKPDYTKQKGNEDN